MCKLVDKATTTGLEDYEILYDAAYVEVMNAVENAMEMTVVEIKQDVIALLNTAYRLFNAIIIERERISEYLDLSIILLLYYYKIVKRCACTYIKNIL